VNKLEVYHVSCNWFVPGGNDIQSIRNRTQVSVRLVLVPLDLNGAAAETHLLGYPAQRLALCPQLQAAELVEQPLVLLACPKLPHLLLAFGLLLLGFELLLLLEFGLLQLELELRLFLFEAILEMLLGLEFD